MAPALSPCHVPASQDSVCASTCCPGPRLRPGERRAPSSLSARGRAPLLTLPSPAEPVTALRKRTHHFGVPALAQIQAHEQTYKVIVEGV